MSSLICHNCYNTEYFEASVELVREIKVENGSLIIEDSIYEDFNYTATSFRSLLKDLVHYVIKVDMDAMEYDQKLGCNVNKYVSCAKCDSKQVTKPQCDYSPGKFNSLSEEMEQNRTEFRKLRRQKHGNNLPVLWQQK